ncbi:MAG: 16S rRNA (guanine(527)-N(7))-methyltransferase RsmG [Bacteroidales bacterium]|nr:16S rRNA (guanine(527)-N(7))-methyltransferase RsmG [Bacteroidales bacterium]
MTFEAFETIVKAEFPELTAEQMEKFRQMDELYRDWNAQINVISRKDIDNFYAHHVLHSLAIASFLKRQRPQIYQSLRDGGVSVLDLGTGGGFPGVPLAIMFPETRFTLCDSVGKKIIVASGVVKALGLTNAETVNARAETLPGQFDYVVSRAVTTLDNFYPWVKDRFKGSIFYLKGGDVNEEIATVMAHARLKKGSVSTWAVDTWLNDEYFEEKFVIQIEKNYLCSPIA